MANEVNVNIAPGVDVSKPIIIHVLEGDAPKAINPKGINIIGDINAVYDFLKTRAELLDKKTAVIIFDEAKGTILLQTDPSSDLQTCVKALLEEFPDLKAFGINQEKYYGQKELEKFVRMSRLYFPDKEAHMKLVTDLKSFSAKVQSEMKSEADNRGNRNNSFAKQVVSDIAIDFVLTIPLFKGQSPKSFRVEICYDVTDSTVRFWLESVELAELQKLAVLDAFHPQREDFTNKGFTLINC
jgi:hypothetical protein